jgi:hypothetical protein
MEHLAALRLYNLGMGGLVYAELMDSISRDAFVQSAEGEALHRFEELVGLPVRTDVDADSRRELIFYRMSVAPYDFTAARMLHSARAAGIEAEIFEDPGNERLRVNSIALIDPTLTIDLAHERLLALLPAHLEWELHFGFTSSDDFDALDFRWNQLDALDVPWQDADKTLANLRNT